MMMRVFFMKIYFKYSVVFYITPKDVESLKLQHTRQKPVNNRKNPLYNNANKYQ